jgi:hypothetical protein
MPNINWAKKIAFESGVSIPGGENWSRAYDLALFEDFSDDTALVLLVTVKLGFEFENDGGGDWDGPEKKKFMNDVKAACEGAWSDKWLITQGRGLPMCLKNQAGPPPRTVARVVILIQLQEDTPLLPSLAHWSLTAYKVAKPKKNYVSHQSDVRYESTGLTPDVPYHGTKPRRSIVREFGHILGYRDEYPDSDRGISAYLSDSESMMHVGETVRDRHYVFFADWISKKLNSEWFVEGQRNLANTPL